MIEKTGNIMELFVWSTLFYTIGYIGFLGLDEFELMTYNLVESLIN